MEEMTPVKQYAPTEEDGDIQIWEWLIRDVMGHVGDPETLFPTEVTIVETRILYHLVRLLEAVMEEEELDDALEFFMGKAYQKESKYPWED